MYLLIDPSEKDLHRLALFDEQKIIRYEQEGANRDLLLAIESFLNQEKKAPKDLLGILVVVGAGGFTSTRIATTVANTFHFAFDIPILGIAKSDVSKPAEYITLLHKNGLHFLSATYSAEANIGGK